MIKLSIMRGGVYIYILIRGMHLVLILRTLVYENNLDAAIRDSIQHELRISRRRLGPRKTANAHDVYIRFIMSRN